MNNGRRPTVAVMIAPLLLLAAMAPSLSRAQADAIASLDIDGNNAFLDDRRQPRSGKDIGVRDGNLVRTGKRTSAMIHIISEGQVQLNENSAKLVTRSFFRGARCFAVRLIAGELFINGDNVCFLTNVGAVSGISHSRINIRVDAGATEITVIEGSVELEGQAAPVMAYGSEQIVVHADGRHEIRRLSPEAALRTAEWTTRYFDARSSGRGGRVAGGILGAILGAVILREVLDDDDDDRRRRDDPPPQPAAPQQSTDDGARSSPEPPAPPPTPQDANDANDANDAAMSRIRDRSAVELRLQNCCLPRQDYGEDSQRMTPAACKASGGRLSDTCTRPVR